MDELKKSIAEAKKAINRIRYEIDQYDIPKTMPDWDEVREDLIYLNGFLDCWENVK